MQERRIIWNKTKEQYKEIGKIKEKNMETNVGERERK